MKNHQLSLKSFRILNPFSLVTVGFLCLLSCGQDSQPFSQSPNQDPSKKTDDGSPKSPAISRRSKNTKQTFSTSEEAVAGNQDSGNSDFENSSEAGPEDQKAPQQASQTPSDNQLDKGTSSQIPSVPTSPAPPANQSGEPAKAPENPPSTSPTDPRSDDSALIEAMMTGKVNGNETWKLSSSRLTKLN